MEQLLTATQAAALALPVQELRDPGNVTRRVHDHTVHLAAEFLLPQRECLLLAGMAP
jgi:hypothetical protein